MDIYKMMLSEQRLNQIIRESVASVTQEHKWHMEREALKRFLVNNGRLMRSKENGKTYKVYYDQTLSNMIGYQYCICVQYSPYDMSVGLTPYIRAYDKFEDVIW